MATVEHFAPVKPEMSTFIICRMVQYTMEKGLCKYSIAGFVQYAMLLCTSKITKVDIEGALRIAKAAMSCSKTRYDRTDQLPFLYCVYYGFVAVYTEPLQTCADMLRQGFDAGMSLGDTCNAFFNSVQHIKTALIVGDRLPTLLKKVDYYLKLASTYQNETLGAFLLIATQYHYFLEGNQAQHPMQLMYQPIQLMHTSWKLHIIIAPFKHIGKVTVRDVSIISGSGSGSKLLLIRGGSSLYLH